MNASQLSLLLGMKNLRDYTVVHNVVSTTRSTLENHEKRCNRFMLLRNYLRSSSTTLQPGCKHAMCIRKSKAISIEMLNRLRVVFR